MGTVKDSFKWRQLTSISSLPKSALYYQGSRFKLLFALWFEAAANLPWNQWVIPSTDTSTEFIPSAAEGLSVTVFSFMLTTDD